jgi:O-acetyl-ADP-ribose deacetylase (regulator of RNase III)
MGLVFVSHNHVDDPFVDRLVTDLNSHGIETFVDHRNLRHGQHWPTEVESALNQCNQMIAVVSDYSKASKNCTDEWNVFIEDQKEIIPVWLTGDKMYFRFRTVHYVDFRTNQYDEPLRRLIGVLTDAHVDTVPADSLAVPEEPVALNSRLAARYPLARRPEKAIGIATGNIAELTGVDVLVNSENTRLRMDRIEGRSVSATLNAFGAEWDEHGELISETLDLELQEARHTLPRSVPPGTVVVTSAGSLRKIGVRHIVHAVSVIGRRNGGFEPATRIQLGRCVTNSLAQIDDLNRSLYHAPDPLRIVAFPIFGTGEGGISTAEIAQTLVERAIDYLEVNDTRIETAYFVAYRQKDLDELRAVLDTIPDLAQAI